MEPTLVKKDQILLAGAVFFGTPEGGEFARTWDRYLQIEELIPNRVNPRFFYGAEIFPSGNLQEKRWTYFAGTEVSDLNHLPMGVFGVALPAATYAVFSVKGGLDGLSAAFKEAYEVWLPSSMYRRAFPIDFELYDERFKHDQPEASEMDIYIPVVMKSD